MSYVTAGKEYARDSRYLTTRITADGRDGFPVEAARYRLVVSRACPWGPVTRGGGEWGRGRRVGAMCPGTAPWADAGD